MRRVAAAIKIFDAVHRRVFVQLRLGVRYALFLAATRCQPFLS